MSPPNNLTQLLRVLLVTYSFCVAPIAAHNNCSNSCVHSSPKTTPINTQPRVCTINDRPPPTAAAAALFVTLLLQYAQVRVYVSLVSLIRNFYLD